MYWSIQDILCSSHSVTVKTIAGPNLKTCRDRGAFNRLFESTLSKNFCDDEYVYLLNFVADAGHLSGDGVVLKEMKVDDYEHALCEWVKASRGKDAFIRKASTKTPRLIFV